jgi:hypothetical protein
MFPSIACFIVYQLWTNKEKKIYFWNHVYLLCNILPIYPWLYFYILDSDYLLGSDSDGMHRRAIFATKVEPDRDKFNVKSTCKPYLFCVKKKHKSNSR